MMYINVQEDLADDLDVNSSYVNYFGGLNENVRISENEFADMLNMTASNYPLLSPREKRVNIIEFEGEKINGIVCKDSLVYCIASEDSSYSDLYINGEKISDDFSLDNSEKNLVGMGAYVVIFPDKKYINLLDTTDYGSLERKSVVTPTSSAPITITPCSYTGASYDGTVSDTAPSDPENGEVWVDTSGDVSAYKIWSESTSEWSSVATTYLKISQANIGIGFSTDDAVSISGLAGGETERVQTQVDELNQEGVLLYEVDDDYILIAGIVDQAVSVTSDEVIIERSTPDMDFVIESENRLWGCKYGVVDGEVLNEIYCCKQGDFKNWRCYAGISTDSYAVSLGSDGPFTGAITYGGLPTFFKQDYIHTVYGSYPSEYSMVTSNVRGVAKGNSKSLAIVGNYLYYKSAVDICCYAGSLPQCISSNLNMKSIDTVVSGATGDKLYCACTSYDGSNSLLVYDTNYGLWHKESNNNIKYFARDAHVLYMVSEQSDYDVIETVDSNYKVVFDSVEPYEENEFDWYATTGELGLGYDTAKYLNKILARVSVGIEGRLCIYISYDDNEEFKLLKEFVSTGGKKVTVNMKPRRCDYFRLKFAGKGEVYVISLSKIYFDGSYK